MVTERPGLGALARDVGLRRLLARARRRLEETGGRLEGATVSLEDPTDEERRAVELVLGAVKRGKGLRIPLDRMDAALRGSALGAGLVDLLEIAGGPLRDRPGEREAERRETEALWDRAAGHPAVEKHPGLAEWLGELRGSGRLRRLGGDGAVALIGRVLDVLRALPARGVDRGVLAAEMFGDAHALDDARPEAKLTLSALAHLDRAEGRGQANATRARDRRALWEGHGVLPDAVSSTVLVLRLAPLSGGPVTVGIRALAASGVVAPVTLEMLAAEPWRWPTLDPVFVTENPTVLGVASRRLGPRCPPMICVYGMPSLAARRLLDDLRGAGVRLRYHGDFGAGGIRIGNVVIGEHGAEPWRFSTGDYEEAISAGGAGTPIVRPVPDAVWDPMLAPALRRAGREVQEEQVLPVLLRDLETAEGDLG